MLIIATNPINLVYEFIFLTKFKCKNKSMWLYKQQTGKQILKIVFVVR